jgi:hypothetical protein
MAFLMIDPREKLSAMSWDWFVHGSDGPRPTAADLVCECAVCGRQVNRLFRCEDIRKDTVTYVAQCHGATDRIELGWAGIIAGPMALPLTAFVDGGDRG